MDVSVVIPAHNESTLTRRCLDGLLADVGDRIEAIVVDDGSTDRTAELLSAYEPQVTVVRHDGQRGFSAACNSGARRASTPWILFLNNDTVGVPGWLDALIAEAEQCEDVGAVGAKLLYPDATVQHAGIAINANKQPFHIYSGFPSEHPAVNRSRDFRAVTGACMLVPRAAFERVGGFDEGFVNCYEDVDLCLRLGQIGLSSRLAHRAVLYHLESRSRDTMEAARRNERLLQERWAADLCADDVQYYLDDRLIELQYEFAGTIKVAVSPYLGSAETGVDGIDVEQVLARRAHEVASLRAENHRLESLLLRTSPGSVAFLSDGSTLRLEGHGDAEQAASDSQAALVNLLQSKTAPLRLSVTPVAPPRINLLLATLDTSLFFGGYATILQLAGRLAEHGVRVRLVTLDAGEGTVDQLLPEIRGLMPGLADLFRPSGVGSIEVTAAGHRDFPLAVNEDDVFVATSAWSAHVAHGATRQLGSDRFIFLIQEDELLFYPAGSFSEGTRAAYELPHFAVFSTELLRDWFDDGARGVYAPGAGGPSDAVTFRNAIVDVGEQSAAILRDRRPHRLLIYARPGGTEARNLFELAFLGLQRAAATGVFEGSWEFTGIGATEGTLALPNGSTLRLIPRLSRDSYRAVLQAHDVGLALMDSPHPSLVPIEMAAAGMPTVTSTFGNKDATALAQISTNLIACAPRVGSIVDGLREAAARVHDVDGRINGSAVNWSRSAHEAFDETVIASLLEFAKRARAQ